MFDANSKKKAARGVAILLLASAASACDWAANQFFNNVSLSSRSMDSSLASKPMHVYIGVDGLSHEMISRITSGEDRYVDELSDRRTWSSLKKLTAFKPTLPWSVAKSISMFPASSDSCWTRMLRGKPLEGHEFSYYDPTQDQIVNAGLPGLARHLIPSIADRISVEANYFKAFDLDATGYTHHFSVYGDSFNSFSDILDQLLFVLEGHLRTDTSFTAYISEIDAAGHMQATEDVDLLVRTLLKRLEEFRDAHPERDIEYTLFSDHGMDFTPLPDDGIQRRVELQELLADEGVRLVEHLNGRTPDPSAPYAIPLGHTRVNYEAAYTAPALVPEVARRASLADPIDLVLGHLQNCPDEISGASECHGIWAEGTRLLSFGYRSSDDSYEIVLGEDGETVAERLDFPTGGAWDQIRAGVAGDSFNLTDSESFNATANLSYPDLFHRIRTGLEALHILYPPQILVSYRQGYVSKGFSLPFASDDIASHGFHGSLLQEGSAGVMMTTEKELPEAVRMDSLLDRFPDLAEHVKERFKE